MPTSRARVAARPFCAPARVRRRARRGAPGHARALASVVSSSDTSSISKRVKSREPITCFTGGVARASRARARRDPPADATTDLARDDRDTAPRPRAAPVPTAAGRVEHWPAIPPGARSEIDNRPPPRNAKRRSGLTVTLGRCCPRRLAARFADVVGFHRPRLNSPRLHTAARTRLPVGSTPRPTRSVMPRRAATCTTASFFFGAEAHEASAGSAPTAAGGERNQFVSLRVSRRRRLRVRPPRASSAKGPRAHLVRVAEDAFQRLDETSGSLSVDHLRRLARTSSTLSTILSARARKFRSKSTR